MQIHLYIHLLIHSLIHSFIPSRIQSAYSLSQLPLAPTAPSPSCRLAFFLSLRWFWQPVEYVEGVALDSFVIDI